MRARLFGTLSYDASTSTWRMKTDEAHVVIRLKRMFPRIPKTRAGTFVFQGDDLHARDLDWFLQRYPMEVSSPDRRRLGAGRNAYVANQEELERILQHDWRPPKAMGLREGQVGRQYQQQAVEVALKKGGLLLGDDVGLGKTYTAILLALRAETLPMAVVVEAHLQNQWAEKISEFSTLESHMVRTTKPYVLPDVPIVLFRYSNIAGWTTVFANRRFRSVTYDEIQNLRTGTKTDKGSAAKVLSDNVEFRLGLSATPIFNRGKEIHPILSFVKGRGGEHPLGTSTEFDNEWVTGERVRDPDALGSYLREVNAFMRRTKADIGQQMDPVEKIPVEVPYDHREEKRIEDLAKTLAIKALTASFVERGQAARDLDTMMRQSTGVAKAKGVADFVRMVAEEGQQVLVGGWHRDFYEIMLRELRDLKPCMYTGSESPTQKGKSKAGFLSGENRVMLISLRSGSGLDGIQKCCSNVVIGELDWSPYVHKQLIGRLDREGQTQPVTAFFCHADGGSDPAIVELLGLKASEIKGVIDPNDDEVIAEVDEGKIKFLARRYLERHGITVP